MLHKLDFARFKDQMRRYFKGSESMAGQPLPEVPKALIEDAPRVVRLTIWGVIAFFLFLIVWACFAPIDEVTRGEGKAIPSSKVQKVQNLEGGIVAQIYAKEGEIVEVGQPLLRLDETRFASNVGETEASRLAMALRVQRLAARATPERGGGGHAAADRRRTAQGCTQPGGRRAFVVSEPSPAIAG